MKRTPVSSSNVRSVGYDPETMTLEVAFVAKGNRPTPVYRYAGVPQTVFDEFMASSSKGKYLNGLIKGVYSATRAPDEDPS